MHYEPRPFRQVEDQFRNKILQLCESNIWFVSIGRWLLGRGELYIECIQCYGNDWCIEISASRSFDAERRNIGDLPPGHGAKNKRVLFVVLGDSDAVHIGEDFVIVYGDIIKCDEYSFPFGGERGFVATIIRSSAEEVRGKVAAIMEMGAEPDSAAVIGARGEQHDKK